MGNSFVVTTPGMTVDDLLDELINEGHVPADVDRDYFVRYGAPTHGFAKELQWLSYADPLELARLVEKYGIKEVKE